MSYTNFRNKPRETTRKVRIKREIIKQLQMGVERADIIEELAEEYGYTKKTAENYLQEAQNDIRTRYEGYVAKVADNNYQRLEAIINEAYDKGDMSNAIKAIDTQNKLMGCYETKVKVSTDNFSIKIDE